VREYVERLGGRIATKLPASPFRYKFAVIVEDSPDSYGTHEPQKLPGGYIIVSEHLILAAQNEAEFAGMLAHAMAHTATRDVTRLLTRKEVAQYKSYAGPDSWLEGMVSDTEFMQGLEGQADLMATRAIAASGFLPAAFAEYVRRTQTDIEHPSRSAMPTRNVRMQLIEGIIATLPARSYPSSDEFLLIQQQLR
jgi:predicted Zn-dependent protease